MTRVRMVDSARPGRSDRSGLTGSAEIPDPPAERAAPGLVARLRRLAATVRGTFLGMARVLRLTWAAGAALTVGLGAATAASGLIPLANVSLARLLINTVANGIRLHAEHRPARLPPPIPLPGLPAHVSVVTAVLVLVIMQFLVFAATQLLTSVGTLCRQLLQDKVTLYIQLRIMEHASALDLPFFETSSSYDLLKQVDAESSVRPVNMINSAFSLVQTSITFISMAGLLAALSPPLAVVALLAPVPAFIADAKYGRKGFRLSMWTSPARRRMTYLLQLVTTDTYAKEVQLFGLAPYLTERFRLLSRSYYARQRRQIGRRQLAVPAWTTLSTLAGSAIYAYVALLAVAGRLTLGDLALYTGAAAALQSALQTLFQTFSSMYEDNLYFDVYRRFLAARPGIRAPEQARLLPWPPRGHVVFEHVSFRYPGVRQHALSDVSFELRPGEMVALVGVNGAGKSTLIKLLCRLYDPEEGRILLDGIDLRDLDPRELRSHIGALFQDHVSYQASAAENIGLGDVRRLADRARIEDAAVRAGADELIRGLARGYDTPLGRWFDQGASLSGGEWQRVALGRSFMRDATLLILDEPSSALDARAESDLIARLRHLAEGRTTVYISHRFSTVRRADRIVVLDEGHIIETGTHDELMAVQGVYAELYQLQADAYLGDPVAGT